MARGRKPAPKLWRPDTVDLDGPVYIDSLIQKDWPMHRAIEALMSLSSCNEVDAIASGIMRFAVADVIRRRWKPKLRLTIKNSTLDKASLLFVQKEGLLLTKLLNLVSDVFLLDPQGYRHPAAWWGLCCIEGCSMRMLFHEDDDSAPNNKLKSLRIFEGITADLRNRQNPFHLEHSKLLFDLAINLADDGTGHKGDVDTFYARSYLPYLQARSEVSTFLRKKGTSYIRLKQEKI